MEFLASKPICSKSEITIKKRNIHTLKTLAYKQIIMMEIDPYIAGVLLNDVVIVDVVSVNHVSSCYLFQ